eukprot:428573-Rhodomonas_salina.1
MSAKRIQHYRVKIIVDVFTAVSPKTTRRYHALPHAPRPDLNNTRSEALTSSQRLHVTCRWKPLPDPSHPRTRITQPRVLRRSLAPPPTLSLRASSLPAHLPRRRRHWLLLSPLPPSQSTTPHTPSAPDTCG